jgi:cobalt-zinc-cadmium efflux system membrane fusion protein
MAIPRARLWTFVGVGGILLGTAALLAAGPRLGLALPWSKETRSRPITPEETPKVELAPDVPDALVLPADVARALGVQTVAAQVNKQSRRLELLGKLNFISNRLARVHTRFAGEVVALGTVLGGLAMDGEKNSADRPLQSEDFVKAGQILAVVWSKDLGEKKSELVDALSQLRLDEENLKYYLAAGSVIPEATVRQARRSVETDRIAVARAERTLRSWRLTEEEIDAIKAEAERLRQRGSGRGRPDDSQRDREWARVEVRSPIGGKIVEKNANLGEIVDTSTDLFKVADMSRMAVMVDAYEEDLPVLQALTPAQKRWTVRLKGDPTAPPLEGDFDYIGSIIDPNQHTALVVGRVDNPGNRLLAGQAVTATVDLPARPDEVSIPVSALIEDGRSAVVFVQPDLQQTQYVQRRVAVVRRLPGSVILRGRLTPEQERQGLRAVRAGEQVVSSGAVELKKALEELQAGTAR